MRPRHRCRIRLNMSNHNGNILLNNIVFHVRISDLRNEALQERTALLNWWTQHVKDPKDGFYGEVDKLNAPVVAAPRGLVLYARILWTFSAAAASAKRPEWREMADRAYHYLVNHFEDAEFGGMYWSLTAEGEPLQQKKQLYGIAFAIYGLSEYAKLTGSTEAGEKALALFYLIEKHGRDQHYGGYVEAFTRDWQALDDLRLSEKEANEKKTMNTHLHILEAYSNLYRIHPAETVAEAIRSLLRVFRDHIIDPEQKTMGLFFSDSWEKRSTIISFGHDIEASWLLYEAAETLGDPEWTGVYRAMALEMTDQVMQGFDADGGLFDELNTATGHYNKEKHWWQQAETLVGMMNAFQLSGREFYLEKVLDSWRFIKTHIKDSNGGEWYWGIDASGALLDKEKAGFWKCPYHNVRACMEISRRASALLTEPDPCHRPQSPGK